MLRSGSTAFGTRLVEESRSKAARKPSVQSSSVNCELADELDCKSKRSASSESLISESSAVLKGLRRRGGRHGIALLSQNSVGPSGFVAMLIAMADACFVFRPFVVGSARKMKCCVEVLFHSLCPKLHVVSHVGKRHPSIPISQIDRGSSSKFNFKFRFKLLFMMLVS